jgi:hypothetical protein
MLRYVYGQDQLVAHAVAQLIPHVGSLGFGVNAKAIGIIDEDGRLIGGLVYHNYDPYAEIIEISGAATHPRWLTRGTIARMYQYPFITCGCQMVFQRTPADDERLLGQLAAYDYSFVNVPRMFGRERDGVLCTLTVEDWANNRFNKRLKHHQIEMDAPQQEAA